MIKLRKCKFFKFFEAEIPFLEHIVERHGLRPDSEKIKKIKKLSILIDLISFRLALGLFSYY